MAWHLMISCFLDEILMDEVGKIWISSMFYTCMVNDIVTHKIYLEPSSNSLEVGVIKVHALLN